LRLINIIKRNSLSNIDDLSNAVNNLYNILRLEMVKSIENNPDDNQRVASLILRQLTEINAFKKKIKDNCSNQKIEILEKPEKSGCNGNAVWKCFRESHDQICKKCLLRKQEFFNIVILFWRSVNEIPSQ